MASRLTLQVYLLGLAACSHQHEPALQPTADYQPTQRDAELGATARAVQYEPPNTEAWRPAGTTKCGANDESCRSFVRGTNVRDTNPIGRAAIADDLLAAPADAPP